KHIRHILDHYSLLLDTLHSPSPSLNYDIRRRLTPIESSLQVAKETVLAVSKRVTNLRSNPSSTSSSTDGWLDRPLTVTAKTPAVLDFESSGGRELWFVSHHSIHHLASLRVIAVGGTFFSAPCLDLSLPTNFGVAPSTILSRQESDLTSASSSSVPKSKI
ncbi:hypothetical protein BDY24DRAFT_344458, partial [Mrakia frigida]|uniref:uncharacterized protein n=1 Tax=Mrakia frigida TaxID=29902 RepID=UPI003FCC0743